MPKKVLIKDQVLKIRTLLEAVLLKEDGILWISFYRSAKSTFSANKPMVNYHTRDIKNGRKECQVHTHHK